MLKRISRCYLASLMVLALACFATAASFIPNVSDNGGPAASARDTIAAGGIDTSNALRIYGASLVSWEVSATSAAKCSLVTLQLSRDSSTWRALDDECVQQDNLSDATTALNGAAGHVLLRASSSNGGNFLTWPYARLIVRTTYVGGAAVGIRIAPVVFREAGVPDYYGSR